jgi:transposase-like protein
VANVTGCGEPLTSTESYWTLVQERRDQAAADRFLSRVLDGEGGPEPRVVITISLPATRQRFEEHCGTVRIVAARG